MRVRFLRDYRGTLTFEAFYTSGEVVDLPNGEALALAGAGVVEVIAAVVAQESGAHPAPKTKGRKRG